MKRGNKRIIAVLTLMFVVLIGTTVFGADEEDVLAALGDGANEVVGFLELLNGLLQVDDVDAVALGVDVGSHFGVPAAGLVAEVDACFEQGFHGYNVCHGG